MAIMRSSQNYVSVQGFMKSKVRINWYQAIYKTSDEKLIVEFWKFYNSHRLSKNAAARCVLISYYSTSPAPVWVKKLLSLKHDIKLVRYNCYAV